MPMQLALPLKEEPYQESRLRLAWRRSGLRLPYELALRDRAIAICLRCLADAMHGKRQRRRHV